MPQGPWDDYKDGPWNDYKSASPTPQKPGILDRASEFVAKEGLPIAGMMAGGAEGAELGTPLGPLGMGLGAVGGAAIGAMSGKAATSGLEAIENVIKPGLNPSQTPGEVLQGVLKAGEVGAEGEMIGRGIGGIPKAIKSLGNPLADLAASLTNTDPEMVKAVFRNPKISQKFGEKLAEWEQSNLVHAVSDSMDRIGKRFGALQDGLAMFGLGDRSNVIRVDMEKPLKNTIDEMISSGHRVPSRFTGKTMSLGTGRLDEDSPDYKFLVNKLADLQKDKTVDFGEALNKKRQLDQIINYGIPGGQGLQSIKGEGNRILKIMRQNINESMRQSLPAEVRKEWDAANLAETQAHRALDQLRKEGVSQISPQTTIMRVLRQIRSGRAQTSLIDKASKIGDEAEAAFQDIHDRAVASQFHRWFRGEGGGLWSLVTMKSPRLMGQATAATGSAYNALDKLAMQVLSSPNSLAQATTSLIRRYAPEAGK